MKSEKKFKILLLLLVGILELIGLAIVMTLLQNKLKVDMQSFLAVFKGKMFWVLWVGVYGISLVLLVMNKNFLVSSNNLIKHNEGQNDHLLTQWEMKRSKDFTLTKFSQLSNVEDGIVLEAKANKDKVDLDIILAKKPIHTLVIGTTGSGKTTGFLNPTIQVLANTKTKPSMVISDPKGELFDTHAFRLKQLGYRIVVVDLRNPYESSKWNPFEILINKIDRMNALGYPKNKEEKDGKIIIDGEVWDSQEQIDVKRQEIRDDIYESAKDLTEALCPIRQSTDEGWQRGARGLINAIILAFCEDYEFDLIKKQQFCLTSLYHTVVSYATGECEKLRQYLYNRDSVSKVRGLASTVLETSDKTLSSYLSDVNQYAEWLSDQGILSMTSGNDLDLSSMDDTPTALFIKIPDERETRHKLVTLLIKQTYKALVEKANDNYKRKETKDMCLKRNVYFLLDEFGNLPKFDKLESMITVARSRHIFFEMIIQSYEQLKQKYGAEIANIVKSNCNIKVFLGSDDKSTIEEISNACGKKTVVSANISSSSDKDGVSSSESTKEIPLIYPNELQRLNNSDSFGNAVVLMFGHAGYKSKYTPSYQINNIYKLKKGEVDGVINKPELFNEKEHTYDVDLFLTMQRQIASIKSQMANNVNTIENYSESNKRPSRLSGYGNHEQKKEGISLGKTVYKQDENVGEDLKKITPPIINFDEVRKKKEEMQARKFATIDEMLNKKYEVVEGMIDENILNNIQAMDSRDEQIEALEELCKNYEPASHEFTELQKLIGLLKQTSNSLR